MEGAIPEPCRCRRRSCARSGLPTGEGRRAGCDPWGGRCAGHPHRAPISSSAFFSYFQFDCNLMSCFIRFFFALGVGAMMLVGLQGAKAFVRGGSPN